MENVKTTMYHVTGVEDAAGEGKHIFTSHDDVYEARSGDSHELVLYPEDGRWHGTARIATCDESEAYDLLNDLAGTLEDRYDGFNQDALTPRNFHDGLEHQDRFSLSTGEVTLAYNQQPDVDLELPKGKIRSLILQNYAQHIGKDAAVGATGGGALGGAAMGIVGLIVGGPPGAIAGASGGATIGGGFVGGLGTLIGILDAAADHSRLKQGDIRDDSFLETRLEKAQADYATELSVVSSIDAHTPLLEQVSERNRLDTFADEGDSYDPALMERYDELQTEVNDADIEGFFDLHFHNVDRWQGVTLTATHDTYTETTDFLSFVAEEESWPDERPSIYRDADAFKAILEKLPDVDEERLVYTALDTETSTSVEQLLQDGPGVDTAGIDYVMEQD